MVSFKLLYFSRVVYIFFNSKIIVNLTDYKENPFVLLVLYSAVKKVQSDAFMINSFLSISIEKTSDSPILFQLLISIA